MKAEVIRIIKYSGDEAELRRILSTSLPEGVRECKGYSITVVTHSSNLPPAVELTAEEVNSTLEKVTK